MFWWNQQACNIDVCKDKIILLKEYKSLSGSIHFEIFNFFSLDQQKKKNYIYIYNLGRCIYIVCANINDGYSLKFIFTYVIFFIILKNWNKKKLA